MAYNNKSNDLGLRVGAAGNQAAIVVGAAVQAGSVPITEAADFYGDLMKAFYTSMVEFQTAQGGSAPSGEQMLRDELGATAPSGGGGGGVKILGKQHGPKPEWLDEACRAAGVPAVFDDRVDRNGNDVTGTSRPWFRSPKDPREGPADKPFWPPR